MPPQRQVPEPAVSDGAEKHADEAVTLRVSGAVPPEMWNRLGTKLLPKLRSGKELKVDVEFCATVDVSVAASLESDLRQALEDLGIAGQVWVERSR